MIFGDGSQTRDFTWVEETAAGILQVAACDELVGEAVNVAHGTGVAIRDVCRMLLEVLDAEHLEPEFVEERPGDVMHHWADTDEGPGRDRISSNGVDPLGLTEICRLDRG